uniref:hypothetical protein n=1 Tax=Novacetimonas labruscae TaxID=3229898 RepID=UPI003B5A46D1
MTDRPRTRSDVFARAEERGRHLAATILSGPDMLTGELFAHRLGLAVSDRGGPHFSDRAISYNPT